MRICVFPQMFPRSKRARFQESAIEVFRLLCCEGMARVDFFLRGEDIFINEVNTLPGFTSISMYPKLWESKWIVSIRISWTG